jgi:septal ring factor EnvC (AmiA/AmiB activator)
MMCAIQIKRVVVGLFVALILAAPAVAQPAQERLSPHSVSVPRQNLKEERAPSLIDVEMLKRSEQRGDVLRAQLLDLEMKEIEIQARIDDLDYRLRPECIQQALALLGSPRPIDELRDDLRARLEGEKGRANQQLELLAATQARLEAAIRDADAECALLRERLRLPRASDACGENN